MKTELMTLLRGVIRSVHPLDIHALVVQGITILARTSDLEVGHPVFLPLRAVCTPDELASFDWEGLTHNLQYSAWLHTKAYKSAVSCVRLCVDRALLHRQLYLSRSASTLKLLGQCSLPPCPMPLELLGTAVEFDQCQQDADRALHAGRRLLNQFQDQALQAISLKSLKTLRALLGQARACYESYREKLAKAYELAGYVSWYLQEQESVVAPESVVQSPSHAA